MEQQASPARLSGEITRIIEQLKLPGFNVPAVLEARRKDIEAIAEANRVALAGAESLAAKQREILQQTVRQLQALVLERNAEEGADLGAVVRKNLTETFGNMRALAELVSKSQVEAFDVVSARVQQSIAELRALLPRAS